MNKFRVSWIESRFHYIEVEADDELEAIEKAEEFEYDETASDDSIYGEFSARLTEDNEDLS